MRRAILALTFALLSATVAVAQDQAVAPTTVSVELSEFKFNPKVIELKPHTAYVLHLVDTGASGHDLVAPEFFKAVTVDAASADKVKDGKVELKKGESVDIALTTGDAAIYTTHCSHPGHALFGMKGSIEVK